MVLLIVPRCASQSCQNHRFVALSTVSSSSSSSSCCNVLQCVSFIVGLSVLLLINGLVYLSAQAVCSSSRHRIPNWHIVVVPQIGTYCHVLTFMSLNLTLRLHLYKSYSFADQETVNAYEAQKQYFKDCNRHRDEHMDFSGENNSMRSLSCLKKADMVIPEYWLVTVCLEGHDSGGQY